MKTIASSPKKTFKKNSITITATEFIDHNDYYTDPDTEVTEFDEYGRTRLSPTSVTYGIINATLPSGQLLAPNSPDKFLITAPTLQLARDEFWSRWRIYRQARFPHMYVNLTINR